MDGDRPLSFDVLVVSEDPVNNGYILGSLVRRILSSCGKPKAYVEVLRNPRTQGYEHAKELLRTRRFVRYRHMNLFLFLPDADGKDRSAEFLTLEREAEEQGIRLVCCAAVQEVETWLLAGHRDRLERPWQEIRADRSVKENVFERFLMDHGNPKAPGGGREELMKETLSRYDALLRLCPELADLEQRIREMLG